MKMEVLFICFFAVLFLHVGPTAHEPSGMMRINRDSRPRFEPAYSPHAPVVVRDDGDLAVFPGNGTAANPYRIEGYNITSDGICIDIEDTTAHYLIIDCLISAPVSSSSQGIHIMNAPNGTIQDCVIERHSTGLLIQESADCSILNNTLRENVEAVSCYLCDYSLVANNTATLNEDAIRIDGGQHVTVRHNVASNNSRGIIIMGGYFSVFENNATHNSNYGFYLSIESSNVTNNRATENRIGIDCSWIQESSISMNQIHGNSEAGVYVDLALFDSVLSNNTISDSKYGVWIVDVMSAPYENCSFTGNTLYNNGLYLESVSLTDLFTSVDGTTVNDKPLGYFRDLNGTTIDGTDYGQVLILNCSFLELQNGHFANATEGLTVLSSHNCTIKNILCEENSLNGVRVRNSDNMTLQNNTAKKNDEYGFMVANSDGCQMVENKAVMNKHHGFALLYHSDYPVFLDNLADSNIRNGFHITGYSHDRVSSGTFTDNEARDNLQDGFYIRHSELCNLTGNHADNNSQYGYEIRETVALDGTSNTAFENGYDGFYLTQSDSGCLNSNVASQNTQSGFNLTDTDVWNLTENTATGNSKYGFTVDSSDDCILGHNTAGGNQIGFRLKTLFNTSLEYNKADSNLAHGFALVLSQNLSLLENNATHNNLSGFHLPDSANCTLVQNTAIHNALGIELDSESATNLIYMNSIGYNMGLNAYDYSTSTMWDNGTHGNCWSDYSGSGSYLIDGTGGGVDHYPCVLDLYAPTTDQPADFGYEFGSTGNSISWTISEIHPDSYELYRNSSLLSSSPLYESNVTVDVDGLDLGVWNLTLLLFDTFGQSTADTVMVSVVDTTSPEIDNAPNTLYELGSTGNVITWSATDLNPASYEIYRSGGMIHAASWDGSSIDLDIDGLPVGIYEYEIVVFDSSANAATDSLLVTVSDSTNPMLSSPSDILYELGSTGNGIHWNASELDPNHYRILINGSIVDHVSWNGGEINHSIDGLSVGIYNFTIVAYDGSGNSDADSVFAEVVDTVAPSIDSPDDIEYVAGSTGHEISWSVSDLGASFYQILRDGVVFVDAAWDGSPIVVNVDSMSPGTYNLTLVVTDEGGNVAGDTVLVTVFESATTTTTTTAPTITTTTTTAPEGLGMALLGIEIGGFVAETALVFAFLVLWDKFGDQVRLPWRASD
jgi:parallel beta-helix repeat protein